MEDIKTPTNMVANMEQIETLVSQFAIILGSYYKELMNNEIPPELAEKLATDFHSIWWASSLYRGDDGN